MKRLFLFGFLLCTIGLCSAQVELKRDKDYVDEQFAVGQVWKYNTRPGEEASTIEVVRIDKYDDLDPIIHISVKGLKLHNPAFDHGISETIGHLPFARQAVDSSVTEMVVAKAELTDFEEGYLQWKRAFEAGEGGIFTISIAEAVEYFEETLKR